MTEPQIDEPRNDQDRDDIVMAELVHPGGRWLAWGIAAALICAFFVVDVVFQQTMRRLHDSEWLAAFLMGLCIGEVNLIAVWASLAPGNIVLRISWSLLLTMAMWYGLILGSRPLLLSSRTDLTRSEAILLIAVLLGSVAILQIPLWIGKKVFHWRLTRQPGNIEASLQEDRQFYAINLTQCAAVLGTLWILRAIGFRMVRMPAPRNR